MLTRKDVLQYGGLARGLGPMISSETGLQEEAEDQEVGGYGRGDRWDLARDGRGPVVTVAKRHGVSDRAIYTSKKRFGPFQSDDVRRLKRLG